MQKALEMAREKRSEHLNKLFEFLRIPSISTETERHPDVRRAAEWLVDQMTAAGLQEARVMETEGLPIVYGEWLEAGPDAPTVLVYGHYDVQPVDPLNLWQSQPFEPEIRGGDIYARGAVDDKGQMFAHIKAVETILASEGRVPVNLKFLFEGEEELGSPSIDAFVEEHAGLLAADSVLVSDTAFLAEGKPMLVYGLRGLTYMEILVDGPHHDLHSGAYGGTVYNPAQVLAEIIAKLHNDDATVAIPGFYDRVRELSETDREAAAQVDYPVTQWQQETGMDKPWGEAGYSLIERRGGRPTCEVNGIWGGYSGEGGKTIIPAHAGAKISMRLVPDQDPDEIAQLFADFIPTIAPEHVRVTVNKLSGGWPSITPIDSPEMKAAAAALQAVWGVPPVFSREGGSIPVISTFQKVLGASAVLMGFGLPGSKMHAPNEHFKEDHYYKAIEAIIHYYHNLAG